MRKYSIEWKKRENRLRGGWAQEEKNWFDSCPIWRWHYLKNEGEYRISEPYYSKAECEKERLESE